MCPAATPDEFGDASWANAGVATITTKVSVSRNCFFMSVLYQPPLKNAIRKADNFSISISLVTQLSVCVRHLTTKGLLGSNEIAYASLSYITREDRTSRALFPARTHSCVWRALSSVFDWEGCLFDYRRCL